MPTCIHGDVCLAWMMSDRTRGNAPLDFDCPNGCKFFEKKYNFTEPKGWIAENRDETYRCMLYSYQEVNDFIEGWNRVIKDFRAVSLRDVKDYFESSTTYSDRFVGWTFKLTYDMFINDPLKGKHHPRHRILLYLPCPEPIR